MSGASRRGGIPGPESRTGLTRPSMTEAEFERRINAPGAPEDGSASARDSDDGASTSDAEPATRPSTTNSRSRSTRSRAAKPKRVQRMFAIEEDVDKKLWLYAIHMGKDRSEIVNELLRPLVTSMVLYDSRDRRGGRSSDATADRDDDSGGDA